MNARTRALVTAVMTVALVAAAPGAADPPDEGPVTPAPADMEATSPAPWMAVAASGKVESRAPGQPANQWARLERGGLVEPLGHVRTARRGRATLTRDGDVILVSPDAEITLPSHDSPAEVIRQNSGKVLYEVEKKRADRFEVITPFLVAGVKGTQFSIIIEDDLVAVSVLEGHVEVRSLTRPEEKADLFAGHTLMMEGREGRMEIYREKARPEDRPGAGSDPQAKQVRRETRRMARHLERETSRVNMIRLWKDRMDHRFLEDRELETETKQLLREEEQDQLLEDERLKTQVTDTSTKS